MKFEKFCLYYYNFLVEFPSLENIDFLENLQYIFWFKAPIFLVTKAIKNLYNAFFAELVR